MLFYYRIFNIDLISRKIRILQYFRGMLAYIYYSLCWKKVISVDKFVVESNTEFLSNTCAVDGLIEFRWPLLEK